MTPQSLISAALILSLATLRLPAAAEELATDTGTHLVGDIGIGTDFMAQPGRKGRHERVFPYANFDYGRAFARVDTFGVKLLPLGYGDLELAARAIDDGYDPASPRVPMPARRNNSLPIGLGTLQTTPIGALFANVFHDAGPSKGTLIDVMYAAELDFGQLALYPQAGAQRQSAAYIRYYYGVSPTIAPDPAASYQPRSATSPYAALFLELKVHGNWYANANLRRTWLPPAISSSPLAMHHRLDSAMLALSYRYN
ncbi:MipA/OmpV family protein [Rugamonas apoptosis]|uniref:MipA/OmpV family protein n=1 Tax=Rugamonas apoptosis TaxID=2758570 RepID=A0A7W2FF71_9BURK|nr:MipA/OmpV family protein [Rugamonas apoptosis]MBA5690578.1 MipA/OmpV family protein [Rugamonas apoptosis]